MNVDTIATLARANEDFLSRSEESVASWNERTVFLELLAIPVAQDIETYTVRKLINTFTWCEQYHTPGFYRLSPGNAHIPTICYLL